MESDLSTQSARAKRQAARAARRRRRWLILLGLAAGLIALVFFLVLQGKQAKQANTLQIEDLVVGEGREAQVGDTLVVHYTGWLTNGAVFDSSKGRNQPFEFTLGQGRVIQGWDQGLVGMKAGGKRRLTIPPHLAYGSEGYAGVIPPNATLIFEVELLEIK